jgi:molecular chaperone GrpE (heat shock protein)
MSLFERIERALIRIMTGDDESESRNENQTADRRDPSDSADRGGQPTGDGPQQDSDPETAGSDETTADPADDAGEAAGSDRDAERTVTPAEEAAGQNSASTNEAASEERAGESGGGDEKFVTKLSEEELSSWASTAATVVTGDDEGGVDPRQYAPERLERRVEQVETRLRKRQRQSLEGRRELARRRAAYIDQLEARVEELDRELHDRIEEHEREQSQLSTLLDRKEDEIDELETYGHESLVGPIIFRLRENLQGALAHDDPAKLREAVELSLAELEDVLRREDVSIIDPDDDPELDRERHHPVRSVEDSRPENTVVVVERPGFAIEGDVREKARVVVSDGSGESTPDEQAGADESSDAEVTSDEREGADESSDAEATSDEREGVDEPSDAEATAGGSADRSETESVEESRDVR